ncbi:hypothetical protein HAX54_045850 [Datura stramonium]|uniref:Uncharacterized protein n=1 Tax=Datura stramonium TaxID=4076 RepID=A0ABS8WG85_DATST|nr:hypothetical protein [Datura stramonium]
MNNNNKHDGYLDLNSHRAAFCFRRRGLAVGRFTDRRSEAEGREKAMGLISPNYWRGNKDIDGERGKSAAGREENGEEGTGVRRCWSSGGGGDAVGGRNREGKVAVESSPKVMEVVRRRIKLNEQLRFNLECTGRGDQNWVSTNMMASLEFVCGAEALALPLPLLVDEAVSGTDLRTADAARDTTNGLKPTTDWTGVPLVFRRDPLKNHRMSSSLNQFQTFQWRPITNIHTHFNESSTLHLKNGLNDDLPLRIVSPNVSSGKA